MKQQEIPIGIGVHTGVAYFGTMSTADGLKNISAISNEVNLASKAATGEILISEQALKEAASMAANWSRAAWC